MIRYQQKRISRFFGLCLVLALFILSANAFGAPAWLTGLQNKASYSSKHVQAELVVDAPQGIAVGKEVWLGLKIKHEPEWHTYWQNPGDVGVPTQLNWTLPPGISVSEVQWPTPQVLRIADDIIDYGYEGTVLLPVKMTVSQEFQGQSLDIRLHANWLVCRVECIPEKADFELTVAAQQSTVTEVGLFESARKNSPVTLEHVQSQVLVQSLNADKGTEESAKSTEGELVWTVSGLPESWQGLDLLLLPEQKEVMVNHGAESAVWEGNVWTAHYQLSSNRSTEPELISAVVLPASVDKRMEHVDQVGVRIMAPVVGTWPEQRLYEIPPSLWQEDADVSQLERANSKPQSSLFLILGFAFLGGLLLNLMPCVFPVLSMTALSFAAAGEHDQRAQKVGGIAYGIGTVVTMLFLAALLLILRAGGAALGWGFQLQSPLFVSLLTMLFVLIALNLLGVFEIQVFLPQGVSNLRSKNPALDSFCSGVVAVLVSTPCTAPFMGAALGATLVMPAWQTLLVFLFLGVGLAIPLMLLTFVPQLMRWLPKPGAWMLTFKQLMAFPMLGAALWLVWVVSVQTGTDGAVGLLIILLTFAFLIWTLGWSQRTTLTSRWWKWCALIFASLCVVSSLYWFVPDLMQKRVETNQSQADAAVLYTGEERGVAQWGVWSERGVEQYLEQGRIVFVDFTAAWCVTCQMNKKTTLSHEGVLKAFADKDFVLLRADWTNYDPSITAELERLGRSGVPVYALYKAGQKPQLLPEILTPQILYKELDNFVLR